MKYHHLLIEKDGPAEILERLSKAELAARILDRVESRLPGS